jgi:hypothetical protein
MPSMRSAPVAFLALSLLVGCTGENAVPTVNVEDFRVTFSNTEGEPVTASSSCSDSIVTTAEAFAERSVIYRIHFPDGETGLSFDMYVRDEGTTEQEFAYFASGILDGSLETGNISYAGGPYKSDDRDDGETVWYEVEGEARTSFGDLWDNGNESYVITDSTNQDAYTNGCTFRVPFAARAEGGTEPE